MSNVIDLFPDMRDVHDEQDDLQYLSDGAQPIIIRVVLPDPPPPQINWGWQIFSCIAAFGVTLAVLGALV